MPMKTRATPQTWLALSLTGSLIFMAALLLGWLFPCNSVPPQPYNPDMADGASWHRVPPPPGAVPFGNPAQATPAALLYEWKCAICHGPDGRASSYTAMQPSMPAVGNLAETGKTETEMRHIIIHGRGAMPAFSRRLSKGEADALLDYIRQTLPSSPRQP